MDYSKPEVIQAALSNWIEILLPYALNALTACILLIIGFTLARIIKNSVRKRLMRLENADATLVPVLSQLAYYVVLIITLVLILSEFGIQTASIIAVLGAAGLAIGLALQGTLQNVAAGIMLLILRPFQVGDFIEVTGNGGTVDEIGLFATQLHTPQGVFISIPNGSIWADTITNYTKRPERRLDFTVGISYDDDIDKAVGVIDNILSSDKRIQSAPAKPQVIVFGLGDSSVDLQIRAWVKVEDYWTARFDAIRAVKYALDKAQISIPYPHRQVILEDKSQRT
ncbi:MAG: mechanosensitive ion channel domain-containing protein [Pseudomonadota bacterium]